jgi:hypothetical protein
LISQPTDPIFASATENLDFGDNMQLTPSLLLADKEEYSTNPIFYATSKAHGLYDTLQFVLRLSPIIHKTLARLTPGITTNGDVGLEGAQAMSTLLHETIHWWQHIGSTYGFILSLNYPVQSHCTHFDLKKLVKEDGFKKSIFTQALELNRLGPSGRGTVAGIANTIVNNHYDLIAFRAFTLGPEEAKLVTEQKLFEAVGHAFHMTYAHTVNTLATTADPGFNVIPHPKMWEDGFRALKERKVDGYYYGSPVGLWPIGSREIFEGQARFSQIQYLSHACGHRLDWSDFRVLGLLSGIYLKAFEEFLRLTETEWPSRIDDPIVSLFLLVCDLANNPGSGFPFSITPNYESFIYDVNPGARFAIFCRLIALQFPEMKLTVKTHNRLEYESITTQLCSAAKEVPPLVIAQAFAKWFSETGPLSHLRSEYKRYVFRPENYVIRHLFAHFLAFQEDKFKRPEFFCWPGAWMAGDNVTKAIAALFEKHSALFVDKENDDSVFPRLQAGRDNAKVWTAFNDFYHNTTTYDLTNQWIRKSGKFNYDIGWLMASATSADMEQYLRRQFADLFGLDPEDVELLQDGGNS